MKVCLNFEIDVINWIHFEAHYVQCVTYSVPSAPCHPTEISRMRTCWVPCSGTGLVSSGSDSDIKYTSVGFTQPGHPGQILTTVPHYSSAQLCPSAGPLIQQDISNIWKPGNIASQCLPPACLLMNSHSRTHGTCSVKQEKMALT